MSMLTRNLPRECRDFTIATKDNYPENECYEGKHIDDLYYDIFKSDKEYKVLVTDKLFEHYFVLYMKPVIKINKETNETYFLWRTITKDLVNNLEGANNSFALAYAFKEVEEDDLSWHITY